MSRRRQDQVSEIDRQLELQTGRRAPFSQLADWVLLTGASPQACRLYWALCMHLNISRGDLLVWPSQKTLAELLGYSNGRKLRKYLRELETLGAIRLPEPTDPDQDPKKHYYYENGLRRKKTICIVHQTAPPGFAGLQSLTEWYAERNERRIAEMEAADEAAQALRVAEFEAAEPLPTDGETAPDFPGGRNGPPGNPGPETLPPGGPIGTPPGGPFGPPNKTKFNKTNREQDESGGHPAAPPNPRRTKTPGQPAFLVTDQRNFSTQQQTARDEKPAPTSGFPSDGNGREKPSPTRGKHPAGGKTFIRRAAPSSSYDAERRAVQACPRCDDAGLTGDGARCLHDALRSAPERPHTHDSARAG